MNASEETSRAVDGQGVATGPGSLGPVVRLEALRPLLASTLAPAATGLAAWPVVAMIDPALTGTIPRAMAAVAGAFVLGVLVLRPWRALPVARWLQWWMGTLGACLLVTVAAAVVLLYSASPEERATLGILIAVGHFVTLMAFAIVLASLIRHRCDSLSAGAPAGAQGVTTSFPPGPAS